ncbi:hypothetical protein Pd630_LPD03877 [Rhodococcus opacus PD630]|nr:hypothetical protein Pd630_LPD03877 [Rhodococcus opacus PD630]
MGLHVSDPYCLSRGQRWVELQGRTGGPAAGVRSPGSRAHPAVRQHSA